MKFVYHLNLNEEQVQGAEYAIIPGDPSRVEEIGKHLKNGKEIAFKREFRTFIGELNNKKVLVTSTGIGGPSTSIAVEELAQLGVKTFIRIGTTGAIQSHIELGEVIITTASVRLDGASVHYAPIEYPAVANYEIVHSFVEAAKNLNIKLHLGITASSDTFYQGQERYDSFTGYVRNTLKDTMKEWQALKVLNYEMESATLLTMVNTFGLRAGCCAGVIVNRTKTEVVAKDLVKLAEKNSIELGIKALSQLIEDDEKKK